MGSLWGGWLPGLAAAVVALGLCGQALPQMTAQAPPPAVAVAAQPAAAGAISDGVVKIGLILDMSGPLSSVTGIGSVTAAKMAAADFGGRVLGAPIEVVYADHGNSPDRAAAIARDWLGDQHVDAIMDVSGPYQDPSALLLAPHAII